MFCPNCGKDCGSAKFCPECGEKLQQVAKKDAVWQVGMPCPNCGGTKLDGNNCLFCGAQLVLDLNNGNLDPHDSYEIPTKELATCMDKIRLEHNAVVIKKQIIIRNYGYRIPYEQLTEVRLLRPSTEQDMHGYGRLTIRHEGNKYKPIEDNRLDKTSIMIDFSTELLVYHIFCVLRLFAPSSTKFSIREVTPLSPDTEQIISEVDMDECFAQYNPYRGKAVSMLLKTARIMPQEAKLLIDKAFDLRQEKLYKEDPSIAIRDLNRIIQKTEE